ncbi:flagellar FliJ family protein [Acetobacter vaccinii]|uniref:Flagellar FliJ protein n=1 Tax=Acetobacter vaccinii TaxID=2592655 RepID=A0A5C1YKU6_9PROT|nr:flagellar FliJ family protein [Acetobacter vaccinii]QEO16904.1 hypothetical protein FLP30_03345 [Acetobacter vaccinii]
MSNPRTRALQALIRLRKTEVEQARSAMAAALAHEQAAIDHTEAQRARIVSERAAIDSGGATMDDFRSWFPLGREAVQKALMQQHSAEAETEQARKVLMEANGALKAAETLLETRLKEEKDLRERREMAEIDDLSRRNRMATP